MADVLHPKPLAPQFDRDPAEIDRLDPADLYAEWEAENEQRDAETGALRSF